MDRWGRTFKELQQTALELPLSEHEAALNEALQSYRPQNEGAVHQKALDLRFYEKGDFSNWVSPAKSAAMIESICRVIKSQKRESVFICGKAGSGKSHLISALANAQASREDIFIADLALYHVLPTALLDAAPQRLTLLDNVDAIAGHEDWELALFALFNRFTDGAGINLVMTAKASFDQIAFLRSDLASRLSSGLSLSLDYLSKEECAKALTLRAAGRELKLELKVAEYMVEHCNRDMRKLVKLLDLTDKLSLDAGHALTIPFVKDVMQDALKAEA